MMLSKEKQFLMLEWLALELDENEHIGLWQLFEELKISRTEVEDFGNETLLNILEDCLNGKSRYDKETIKKHYPQINIDAIVDAWHGKKEV